MRTYNDDTRQKQLENSVQKWQFNVNSCNMLGTTLKCAMVYSVAVESLNSEAMFSSDFSQHIGFYLAIVLAAQTFSTYKLESQKKKFDYINGPEFSR